MELATYTFFTRPSSNLDVVRNHQMDLPATWTVEEAYAHAIATRVCPKGTHQSGCFEIQVFGGVADGLYNHIDRNRIDFSTPRKAAKVTYKTWDQVDAEMEADPAA